MSQRVGFPRRNVTALMQAVALTPVAALVTAKTAWQHYSGGVMTPEDCGSLHSLDHAVLIVGYNVSTLPGYWLVKNELVGQVLGRIGLHPSADGLDLQRGPAACGAPDHLTAADADMTADVTADVHADNLEAPLTVIVEE